MPTNVSTPIWACNVCNTRHGNRLDVAEACEASPVPDIPTVELTTAGGTFHLVRLTDHVMRTDTSEYNFMTPHKHFGHYWSYRTEDSNGRYRADSRPLVPGTAGYVQVRSRRHGLLSATGADVDGQLDFTVLAQMAGLRGADSGTPARSIHSWTTGSWVGPITDAVREVYETLDTRIYLDRSTRLTRHQRDMQVSTWLDGTVPGVRRAQGEFRLRDHDAILDELYAAWQAWWGGANIRVPNPPLVSASRRTASTLTKPLRELTERVGVEWRPRTDASEYVRTVTANLLGVKMERESRLFDGLPVVAVGGGRGGVGKSKVARWVAGAFAAKGENVVLLDLDLTAPAQHLAFGLTGGVRVNEEQLCMLPEPVPGGYSVFSAGQFGTGTALPARWSERDITSFIDFVAGTLDLTGVDRIVVDLPAGDGVERRTLCNQARVNLIAEVIVTTADPHALAAAEAAIEQALHENHRRILVENMSTATGPGPDGADVTIRLRGDGTEVAALASAAGVTFAGSLPWSTSDEVPQEVAALADLIRVAAPAH